MIPKYDREGQAIELLRCALTHEPESRLLGNVRAREIVAIAASLVTSSPACGAEPWVNIDCALCETIAANARDDEVEK